MSRQTHSKPVIVIGAGIGGLSTAIRLAARGFAVRVLEKNPIVGGKMYRLSDSGFYFDTGPSIITMRHVFEALFDEAGRKLDDYIQLEPVEPLTRYRWPDGTRLDATRDLAAMTRQIAAIDERDVEGYLSFLSYAARLHRITGPAFIYGPPPSIRSFAGVDPRDLLRINWTQTLDAHVRRHVRSPHVRQILNRYATYTGASPYQAPAMLSVIAHVELAGGVWYPRGGIHAVASGMARLARELGVQICTDAPVASIEVTNGRATGVRLASGERLPASAVVANVDLSTVYKSLLPGGAQSRALERLKSAEPSCSGFVLLLGVEGERRDLLQHNIFFCRDYAREFSDIFRRGVPPDDPTVYVSITSKVDADHAPPGCENWFVLVNAPAADGRFDWATEAPGYRDRVLSTLARFGLDVRDAIRSETILTPLDIEQMSGAWRGALYGVSSNRALNAFRRPHNRAREVKGLYFAGGTTHPGGGVPMVTLSGKVAADMVSRDLKA